MIRQANGCSTADLRATGVVHPHSEIASITRSDLKRLNLVYWQSIVWRFFDGGYGAAPP
jgi:hypothetical protein